MGTVETPIMAVADRTNWLFQNGKMDETSVSNLFPRKSAGKEDSSVSEHILRLIPRNAKKATT